MRKFCLVLFGVFLCIDSVNAAVRAQNNSNISSLSRQASSSRTKPDTSASNRSISSRNATTETKRKATARTASNKIVTGRNASNKKKIYRTPTLSSRNARAATTVKTRTFGSNYDSCRDSYFTCMDQFCATQNETYRRCVCSSKLKDIQKQEKQLSQTSESLTDFQELNIDMISKTSNEVKAMLSASEGEAAIKKDTSNSANTLKNISNVLTTSKSASTKNNNKDITADIKSVWSTTDLIGGADIANLTGEALFNAVHTQCAELVANDCASSDLKMVASAYGMYIENDCSLIETNLKNKKTAANAAIRDTRHKMQDTRLENYDVHNSVNINDCIANVRKDITANSACGEGYIHCLDFSGKYLNITTGAPIYSPEFFQIEKQITLSGDVLKNNQNATFIQMLNKKRTFAAKSLDVCRDNADDVWNEFLRQALVEIYQGQQERVKKVKEECLQVVNQCYLKQSDSLKNFAGEDSKINIGQTLELSEELCADKLNTCSNLYGGSTAGLDILISTMTGITDKTIEQSCPDMLNTFVNSICAVQVNDSAHSFPYGCRKYAPGESLYALNPICNEKRNNPFSKSDILITYVEDKGYISTYEDMCKIDAIKIYTNCKYGYYLYSSASVDSNNPDGYNNTAATECHLCPSTKICSGGTSKPTSIDDELYKQCGQYYIGSLYQQLVTYALENCRRPSETSYVISESLLAKIDNVMNEIRPKLVEELSKECSNQSGTWVDIPWEDQDGDGLHDHTGDALLSEFYLTTGTNAHWGYCRR